MSEDEIDEELESIEYAKKHIDLVINELEDLDYWRTELQDLVDFKEKLENRELDLDSFYEEDNEYLREKDLVYQDMRYEQELDRRWGI